MFGKKKSTEETIPVAPVNPDYARVDREYKRDVLIVESKPRIRKALFLFWILLNAGLLIVIVAYLFLYFVGGSKSDRMSLTGIDQNVSVFSSLRASRAAAPLEIGSVRLFPLDTGRYDFLVPVKNPNAIWYAEFSYYFTSSQGNSAVQTGFILPGSDQYVVSLAQEFASRPSNPELVIESISWHRVAADQQPGRSSWLSDHDQFTVSNAVYGIPLEFQGSSVAVPRSTFTVRNDSAYSYWSADFLVLITRAGSIAAVDRVSLANFASGDEREVALQWLVGAPSSGEVVVVPQINYLDSSVYLNAPRAGEGDLRDQISDRLR